KQIRAVSHPAPPTTREKPVRDVRPSTRASKKRGCAAGSRVTRGPMKNLIAVTLMLAAAAGCGRLGGGGAPKSEDDKTLYALGMIIGRNLADFNLTARELDIVKAGMTDTVEKKKAAIDLETYGPKVDKFHGDRRQARAATEKKQGVAAVEAAAKEPG